MPILAGRRSFLKHTAASFALPLLSAALPGANEKVSVALISDTHIAADPADNFRGFSPHKNLRQVVDQVALRKPDVTLVNGDLARKTGEVADYAAFTGYLDSLARQMPCMLTLGNHDDRKNARNAWTKWAGENQPVEQKLVAAVDVGPFSFVLLDSLMATNVSQGQVGRKQRDWLADYLDQHASKPTLVFVHHNPDPDNDGALVDAERLLAILRPRRSVKALFFGHMHVYTVSQQDGLHLVNLPATSYNFAEGNPVGWVESSLDLRGADLTLHAIAGETKENGKTTRLTWR